MFTFLSKAKKRLLSLACIGIWAVAQPGCRAPKDLEYKGFKNFSVGKLGFGSSDVKLGLIYYNPNKFGLQLKRVEIDIYIDGTYLGHASQDHQITIPRLSEFSLPITVAVDMKNVFKDALTTLFNKQVTVKITGRLKLGKANVFFGMPINYEGQHNLSPLF